MTRPSADEYFLRIAREVSTRATCPRLSVGCVLVRDRTILATGYNGSIRGLPHCEDVGCEMVGSGCRRTVHAEANAIAQAAKNGAKIDGATAYVTTSPCRSCLALLVNAGISRIVFASLYRDASGLELATAAGVVIEQAGMES